MNRIYIDSTKPFISYKPTAAHYKKALVKKLKSGLNNHSDVIKLAYLCIKYGASEKRSMKEYFEMERIIGELTPREFMQMFPIKKEYDGDRWGVKDYWFTLHHLGHYRMDFPIGSANVFDLLMDYWNIDVNLFVVNCISALSDEHRKETGSDLFTEFFEIEPHYIHDDKLINSDGEVVGKLVRPTRYKNVYNI